MGGGKGLTENERKALHFCRSAGISVNTASCSSCSHCSVNKEAMTETQCKITYIH